MKLVTQVQLLGPTDDKHLHHCHELFFSLKQRSNGTKCSRAEEPSTLSSSTQLASTEELWLLLQSSREKAVTHLQEPSWPGLGGREEWARRRGSEVLGKDLGQEEEEQEEGCGSELTNRGETVHQISAPPAGAMASRDGPAPKQKGRVVR